MNTPQLKSYIVSVLKTWFGNKSILDRLGVSNNNKLTFDNIEVENTEDEIIEILSEDFDRLSSAEKNNGKTYFIPNRDIVNNSTVKKQVLTAGNTSITFTDIPTTGDYIVDFFNSLGISYTTITPSNGSVTITYAPQSNDIDVYCEIRRL